MNLNKVLIKFINLTRFMMLINAFIFGQVSINTSTLSHFISYYTSQYCIVVMMYITSISDHFQFITPVVFHV